MREPASQKLIAAALARGWTYTWEQRDVPVSTSWLLGPDATDSQKNAALENAKATGQRVEKTYSNFRPWTRWIFVPGRTLILRLTAGTRTYVVEADFVNDRLVQIATGGGLDPGVSVSRFGTSNRMTHCPERMILPETLSAALRFIEYNSSEAAREREKTWQSRYAQEALRMHGEVLQGAERRLAQYDAEAHAVYHKAVAIVGAKAAAKLQAAGLLSESRVSRSELVEQVEKAKADVTEAEDNLASLKGDS